MQHGWKSRDSLQVRLPCLGSGVVSDVTSLMLWQPPCALSLAKRGSRGVFQLKDHEEAALNSPLPELIQPRLRQEKIAMLRNGRKACWLHVLRRQVPTNKQEANGRHKNLDVTAISCGVHQAGHGR